MWLLRDKLVRFKGTFLLLPIIFCVNWHTGSVEARVNMGWHASVLQYTPLFCFPALLYADGSKTITDFITLTKNREPANLQNGYQPLILGRGQPAYYLVYSHDNTSFLFPVKSALVFTLRDTITCPKAANHTSCWPDMIILDSLSDQKELLLP